MSSDRSRNQLKKNILSLTVVQIATYILPLISVPVISRIIGPGRYGIINFSAAYVAYFTLLISYSFDFTATRKLARDPDNKEYRSKIFSEVFYAQCILFLISTAIFIVSLFFVPELQANSTIFVFSYLLCVSTLFTQNWLFQAMQDLTKVALFNLTSKLLFTISILIIIRHDSDYIWQPLIIGVAQGGIAIWSFIWACKRYEIRFIQFSMRRCFKVLWEERVVFISLVFVNFYSTTNTVILGLYQNAEQVGYYTAAQRLIIIAQSVLAMPLAQAFYPYIAQAFVRSREDGLVVAQKLVPLIILLTGSASILMILLGPLVISLFYGHKFDPSILSFQLLSIVPLLFSLNNVLGIQIMINLGMDRLFLIITAAAGILSIVLNIVMIRKMGYIGSTLNWIFIEIFLFTSMFISLKRRGLNPVNLKYFRINKMADLMRPALERFWK